MRAGMETEHDLPSHPRRSGETSMRNTVRRNVSRALVVLALSSAAFLAASESSAAPLASESCNDKDNPPAFCKAVPGDRAEGWLPQGRSEVMARNGMVTTSQPLAAETGLEILRQGGNAVDAAVATAAVLNLMEPMNVGLAGDMSAILSPP